MGQSMKGAALCALLVAAAFVAVAQAGDVNIGALYNALKYKKSKTSAFLIYQQQDQLALAKAPRMGGPNTVLMPTGASETSSPIPLIPHLISLTYLTTSS